MNHYLLDIKGIGPVSFHRSNRAKRVVLSVTPRRGVRVAVPTRVSFKKAEEFARSKSEWINKHLERMRQRQHINSMLRRCPDVDYGEAKQALTVRLEELARLYGFTFSKVSFRQQKTRWGSCSSANNISLNINLTLLPGDLRDYVLLHELVHTRIRNHSSDFWGELDKYIGDAKAEARRLREINLGVIKLI
ncbi:MAG: DUF45 domain-containing protein [Chloroflexi bacterium]|nr:DUF45 domain-containing protein [Chloroflexota bacterium]